MVKAAMTSTEETREQKMNKIKEEGEHVIDFSKQHRKRYAEQRGRIQRKKKKRELQAGANE